jgi:hypothetical protein
VLVEEVEDCVLLWVVMVEWEVEVDNVEVEVDVDVGAEEVEE